MQQGDYRIAECRGRFHIEIYWYDERRFLFFKFRSYDWYLCNPWGAAWELGTTPQAMPEVYDSYAAALAQVQRYYTSKDIKHHYIARP
jgi:hypothetical protein